MVGRRIGYQRYNSRAAFEALNRTYNLTRPCVNFFQTDMKLVHKSRYGAKVRNIYDRAQTPYQRFRSAGILSETKVQELATMCHRLYRFCS